LIKEISEDLYSEFAEKLATKTQLPVFASSQWLSLYGKELKRFGLFEKNEIPKAVFLACSESKGLLKILKTPAYMPSCSLIMDNPGQNKVKRHSKEKKWLTEIAAFLKEKSRSVVFLAFPPEYIDFQPFLWAGLKVTPQYTYRLNLQNDLKAIELGMSPERRNDLKRAVKDGVTLEQTNDYKVVEQIISKTFARKDKSFDRKLVSKILFEFATEANSFAFVAKYNGVNCATSFIVHNGHTAYYLLGGYDHKNTHAGAGACAVWKAIQYSQKLGLETFDFEGSMIPEVERYFRGFGGELTPYYLVHKGPFVAEVGLKIRNPELF
jgi:hypothetical protein